MSLLAANAASAAASHRSNNFDAMRLLAALLVLISHQYLLTGQPEIRLYGAYSLGDLGVVMFFAISGFLVTRSWMQDPHVLRFFARRMLRVWPALAVLVLLTTLGLGPIFTPLPLANYLADPRFAAFFANLWMKAHTDLPVQMAPGPFEHIVNGSLWTIPLEVRCYVLLALLGVLGLLRWRWVLVGLALAFAAYHLGWLNAGVFFIRGDAQGRSLQLEFIACFFLGAALARFPTLLRPDRALMLVALSVAFYGAASSLGNPVFAIWLAVPLLTLAVGSASWPVLRRAGRFGDLSYGVYLYAFTVQQIVIRVSPPALQWWMQLGLAVVLTGTCALASWHWVEKRALHLKPHAR